MPNQTEKIIPNGWIETTLEEVAEFSNGRTSPERFASGKYEIFGSNGIIGLSDKINSDANTIIIGRVGSYCGSLYFSRNKCWVTDNAIKANAQGNNDPFYLYYLLIIQQLNKKAAGSGQPLINQEILNTIDITLPPLAEQKAIAAVLSSLDDKIELLRKQNKTLENIAQTIFKEWFVKDKNWDGKLSQYLKVQGGYAFKGEDFKENGFAGIVKITNITMGVVDIHNTQFIDEDIVTDIDEDKFRINSGDFLIAMTGAEIGKIGIVENTKKQIWLNQRVGKLVAKVRYGEIIGYLALRSREGQEHITDTASGSAQANISSTGIEEMTFFPYSEKNTNSFGGTVNPLFKKIIFNLSQIQTLSKLRDTLLPKLMKGEIRVKYEDITP